MKQWASDPVIDSLVKKSNQRTAEGQIWFMPLILGLPIEESKLLALFNLPFCVEASLT